MVKIGNIELGDFPLLLAPMEDVSDPPFRAVCKENGADLVYTEFISSEGLIRDAAVSIQKLDIYDRERPVGIQIFGGEIESMKRATEIAERAKPDLIDINYGCPVKKVICRGAGAGILREPVKMQKMTEEIVKSTHLPVTVKTRLGWDDSTIHINETAKRLQDAGIKALSIHARTRNQMYQGKSDWSYIAKVKSDPSIHIPIFGNGDIDTPEKAIEYKTRYGVDGIMIGRAAIGNPWIFNQIKYFKINGIKQSLPGIEQRIETCIRHLKLSIDWKGLKVGILEMRRHYSGYFRGFENFKNYKLKLLQTESLDELLNIIDEIRSNYQIITSNKPPACQR